MDTDFSTEMMHAMLEIVLDAEHHIIFWSSNNSIEKERSLIESLLGQGVEAIILKPVTNDNSHLKDLNINVPLILVNNSFDDTEHDLVKIDLYKVLERGLRHVSNNGYKEAYLLVEEHLDDYTKTEMVKMFNHVIKNNKLSNNIEGKVIYTDVTKKDDIRNSIKKIVSNNFNDAVVFATSRRVLINAAIVIKTLKEEMTFDVGLAGYDDLGVYNQYSWTQLSSQTITRAVPNWYEFGKQIVLLLQERLDNLKGPKKIVEVDSNYYEGESTSKIYKIKL